MPSFYRPQAFIVARYRLHTQILALSPPAPNLKHRRSSIGWPIARDSDTGEHGFSIASPRPCSHPTAPKR